MSDHITLGVLGAGSYGTALAIAFSRVMPVVLWGHQRDHIETLARDRENKQYVPGNKFPDNLALETDLAKVAAQAKVLLIAVPSHALPEFLRTLKQHVTPEHFLLIATKGLEAETGRFFSEIIPEIYPENKFGFISGPSFAKEVAAGVPTVLAVASQDYQLARQYLAPMHQQRQSVKLYYFADMIGLQIAGAIKNVIAIAVGLCDGLGFGANTRAAAIAHGLQEIQELGLKYGADPKTFQGFSGFGDLVLTCTDDQSRNRRFGVYIGKGLSTQEAFNQIGQVVEGYYNTKETITLARKVGVSLPVIQKVYEILFEGKNPRRAAAELLLSIHNAQDAVL